MGSNTNASELKRQQEMIIRERKSNNTWNKLKRNKTAMIGLIIIVAMVIMAVFAPYLAPKDPNSMDLTKAFLKPGEQGYILGTDEFGRDLLSRIIYGSRISMIVAFGGTLFGAAIGIILGLIAGFKGGIIDAIIMRIMDGMFAFPFILLAIVLMTVLGPGLLNVILAIGIANVPGFARIVRGQVMIVKNEEYCVATRALGASSSRQLFVHILPNTISPLIVYATLNIAGAIISEASMSFLGVGIQPPTASWGNILRGGKDYLSTSPHIATYSGLAIVLTVLGFNLLGDGIRDILDPKMKR